MFSTNASFFLFQEELEALKAKLEKLEAERTTLKHDNDKLEAKVGDHFFSCTMFLARYFRFGRAPNGPKNSHRRLRNRIVWRISSWEKVHGQERLRNEN